MRGEFFHIAARIAERAAEGGISVNDIAEMVAPGNGEVNCYPGIPSDQCHPIAYFVALHGKLAKGRGHYNFGQILEWFVRHMGGRCSDVTRHAVIITDAWHVDHYEKWYDNIDAIKRHGASVEAYLIGIGGRVSRIDI